MAKAAVGTGSTIGFGTSSFAANIVSFGLSRTRPSIDATHLGTTGGREAIAGKLVDGEVTFEISFDSTATIPIGAVAETITITYALQVSSNGTQASHAFTGFITSADITNANEEKITASITVKVAGTITEVLESA